MGKKEGQNSHHISELLTSKEKQEETASTADIELSVCLRFA